MFPRRTLTVALAVAAVGAFTACGDSVDAVQQEVDDAQEQVDRVQDAVGDPAGTLEREADRVLEDAVTPEDQP